MIEKNRIAFLVGMPRAATTFLYHNLNLHPELFIPFRRKTNYFSLHHCKGEDWFFSHFKDAPVERIAVDTETLAFFNPELKSPQLIRAFNPDARLILCVRDPAAWAVSLYHQIATFDSKITSFEEFLAGSYTLHEDGVEVRFRMRDGDIQARIGEYKEAFPNGILILRFRDVTEFPLESFRQIERFLGVAAFYGPENIITKVINSRNRRHNKLLNRLLRNEHLITLLRFLLPRRAVLAARWLFDGVLAGSNPKTNESRSDEAEARMLRLARSHFKSDREALAEYI